MGMFPSPPPSPNTYYWPRAVHIWNPCYGQSLKCASELATLRIHPAELPGFSAVGEASSCTQGWIEGALQTVDAVAHAMESTPIESMRPFHEGEFPQKWVEYQKWMIDVTKWKDVHPGSAEAILKRHTKDITDIFDHVNHSDRAVAILGALRIAVRDGTSESGWRTWT